MKSNILGEYHSKSIKVESNFHDELIDYLDRQQKLRLHSIQCLIELRDILETEVKRD